MQDQFIRVSCVVACLMAFTGCVGVSEYVLSRPTTAQSKHYLVSNALLDLDGAAVYVRPANGWEVGGGTNWFGISFIDTWSRPTNHSAYYRIDTSENVFFIEIYARTDRPLRLNPASIALTKQNGQVTKASEYWGPFPLRSTANESLDLCSPSSRHSSSTAPIDIAAHDNACIALRFNTAPPSPLERFTLEIDGAVSDLHAHPRVLIEFAPTKERFNHP
jgi:hypothetical protein